MLENNFNYISISFAIFVFAMLSLQILLSIIHVKQFQKTIKKYEGTGVLGIGHKKGFLSSGQLLILSYNRFTGKIVACEILEGITIFAQFGEVTTYNDLSLSEIKEIALELDLVEFKKYRKKHPYDENELTKKKGALIQAVENIENWIKEN